MGRLKRALHDDEVAVCEVQGQVRAAPRLRSAQDFERPRSAQAERRDDRVSAEDRLVVRVVVDGGHAVRVLSREHRIETLVRDGADTLSIETHRTLLPVLDSLRGDGYRLVGLEQTSNSSNLHHYEFARRTALVIGNERTGLTEDILKRLDDVVEIPVWGLPYSYNVASAATMALYEYCRQYPEG